MGTNYYWRPNPCEHCGRADDALHIGKLSAGWTFSFHATEDIRSYVGWIAKFAEPGFIEDEYHRRVSLEEFKKLVEERRSEKWNHARDVNEPNSAYNREMLRLYGDKPRITSQWLDFLDSDGHSFSPGEWC